MTKKRPLTADPTGEQPDATTRVLRTIIQVVIAVAGAVPAAVALLPVPATDVAWVVGIAGALVVLVTAVQNAIESRTDIQPLLSNWRKGGDS